MLCTAQSQASTSATVTGLNRLGSVCIHVRLHNCSKCSITSNTTMLLVSPYNCHKRHSEPHQEPMLACDGRHLTSMTLCSQDQSLHTSALALEINKEIHNGVYGCIFIFLTDHLPETGTLARSLNFVPAPRRVPVPEIIVAVTGYSTPEWDVSLSSSCGKDVQGVHRLL